MIVPDNTVKPSFHGRTVLSILAGQNIGVVPDAEAFFYAIQDDGIDPEERIVKCLNQIISYNEENRNDPIRVVSMSATFSRSDYEKSEKMRIKYEDEFERQGCVLCTPMRCRKSFFPGYAKPLKQNSDYESYVYSALNIEQEVETATQNAIEKGYEPDKEKIRKEVIKQLKRGKLIVPTVRRSFPDIDTNIGYRYEGGALGSGSWLTPYVSGLVSLAKQVNPNITYDEFEQIARETCSINEQGNRIMNIEKCLERVQEMKYKQSTIYGTKRKSIDDDI